MDRLSVLLAAMVAAMAVALTVVLVGDGTPAGRIDGTEDLEWTLRLRDAEAALAAGEVQVTIVRLRAAHRAALRTGRWDALVDVGDAARRAGEASTPAPRAMPTASRAYLAALARAREQQSLDGVLRVGEGFAGLGDREMVEYCIGVAGLLAERDGGGERLERVQVFVERYRATLTTASEGLRE